MITCQRCRKSFEPSRAQLAYGSGQPSWRLSTGRHVAPDIAKTVTNLPCIVGVGDTLPIINAPCQMWRSVDD